MPASELETTVKVPRLLTLLVVAEALAVSPHTVRMWVRKGRLTPVRLCRRLLFNPTDIARLVAESTTTQVR
jgi:excisionase family DNA binding protein